MSEQRAPHWLTRVTEIVLVVNAVMATIAAVGFLVGFAPFATAQPEMARRAAAGEFAGALILALVATRLRRDTSLIALPVAFVLCQLVASGYELYKNSVQAALLPFALEGAALAFYVVYGAFVVRARGV